MLKKVPAFVERPNYDPPYVQCSPPQSSAGEVEVWDEVLWLSIVIQCGI